MFIYHSLECSKRGIIYKLGLVGGGGSGGGGGGYPQELFEN